MTEAPPSLRRHDAGGFDRAACGPREHHAFIGAGATMLEEKLVTISTANGCNGIKPGSTWRPEKTVL
jgi:hypothetical protein